MLKSNQLFLISTTDLASGRTLELDRMIGSVARFRDDTPYCATRLLILFQNAAENRLPDIPDWVEAHHCDTLLSLSAARNRLLAKLDFSKVEQADVIAFPDDDAWYPDHSLNFMRCLIAENDGTDFAFCRYGSKAISPAHHMQVSQAGLQSALSFASSNTIFLRASLARQIGDFDERLGLGTPAGAGEDTDFSIRAWHLAQNAIFLDQAIVGHRNNNTSLKYRYYSGSLAAISKNRSMSFSARLAYFRKLLVGAYYIATGKIKLT